MQELCYTTVITIYFWTLIYIPKQHISGTGTASPGMGTVSPMQSEPTNALTEPATTTATPDVVPPILNPFPGGNEITTSPSEHTNLSMNLCK